MLFSVCTFVGIYEFHVGCEVFTYVVMMSSILWDIML
jgi:hypothetical protein